MTATVKFKKLHLNAIIPQYATEGAAGMDLHWDGRVGMGFGTGANCGGMLGPEHGPSVFSTGVAIELPEGYEAQIRPRSSLSGRGLYAALGTIDTDYRGELLVCLRALNGHHGLWVGDRIAQLVIAPVSRAVVVEVDELSPTRRGEGGWGSTGR
jgi:dUTP pyrophosphatase